MRHLLRSALGGGPRRRIAVLGLRYSLCVEVVDPRAILRPEVRQLAGR